MKTKLVTDILRKWQTRTTAELFQIWRANDRTEYSAEAFAAVQLLLAGRGVILTPQRPAPTVATSGWFTPKCPVNQVEKTWIEESWLWLSSEFGRDFFRQVKVILPTPEFFPDPFSPSARDAQKLVHRVCGYMGVNPARLALEFYTEGHPRQALPTGLAYEWSTNGTAGHYRTRNGKAIIGIEAAQLQTPMSLVATVAHELGHVLLLGDGRVSHQREDHEPLTDLLTVFFGLGIFNANSVFRFSQWSSGRMQGWSAQRSGYLTEPMFGYALALFAWLRQESKPAWATHLDGDAGVFYKRALKYLDATGNSLLRPFRNASTKEDFATALIEVGHSLVFSNDLEGAVRAYTKAIKLAPEYLPAYLGRGATLADLGKKVEAMADFEQAIALAPNCAEAYHRRGLLRHQQGELDGALADFN